MNGHSYLGVNLFDDATDSLSLSFVSEDGNESGVTVFQYADDTLT